MNKDTFLENENRNADIHLSNKEKTLMDKMRLNCSKLKNVCELKSGIAGKPAYINDSPMSEKSKPLVRALNVHRYLIDFETDPKYIEYERKLLHRPREPRFFDCDSKILMKQSSQKIMATIDYERRYAWRNVFVLLTDKYVLSPEYLLSILNSSLISFFYQKSNSASGRVYSTVREFNLNELPIMMLTLKLQNPFIKKVDTILSLNIELLQICTEFKQIILHKFGLNKLSKKLQSWYFLGYADFISELGKNKVKLSAANTKEFQSEFLQEAKKALVLKNKIEFINTEINQMMYVLYGLSEDEIEMVEAFSL